MRHISEVINLNDVKENEPNKINMEKSAHVVNLLFKELQSIFPAFKQAWPTQDEFDRAKKNWILALHDQNISTIEQIKYGIKKCRLSSKSFAPSVGEFISWCNPSPSDIGLPDVYEAFRISTRINELYSDYVHAHIPSATVIKHIISTITPNKLRSLPEKEAFKLFEHYYVISCRQYIAGKIDDIPQALTEKPREHPIDKIKADESRKIEMKKIRELLRVAL